MHDNLEYKKILVIGQVWPESKSSAAGRRMLQLLRFFKDCKMEIYFGSSALKTPFSDDLQSLEVTEVEIRLNDSEKDHLFTDIDPEIVMFDRFMTEEQFGWKITELLPEALTILDTEDLHFLRYARQEMTKKNAEDIGAFLYSDRTKRELASIMRCDLSFLISEFEYELLIKTFKIPEDLLYYLPFIEKPITRQDQEAFLDFNQRKDFVFIGNYLHEPNWQSLLYIKTKVWPLIRRQLPDACLHAYGAYPTEKVFQLHNAKQGFIVHGRASEASCVISQARVMLAPITFGAGLKGKFIDAMIAGTPSVTTSMGAEAMSMGRSWGGIIQDDPELLAQQAVLLYKDSDLWLDKQNDGVNLLNTVYADQSLLVRLKNRLTELYSDLESHRNGNYLGQVIKHSFLQNTKYMAMWIELKNKK